MTVIDDAAVSVGPPLTSHVVETCLQKLYMSGSDLKKDPTVVNVEAKEKNPQHEATSHIIDKILNFISRV